MSVPSVNTEAFEREREIVEAPRRVRRITAPSFSPLGLLRGIVVLWQYRDLLYTLSVHRIKVRYKQSVLGILWAVLQPLSLMLIYTLVFSVVARIPTGGTPYPIIAFTGLLLWTLFSTAIINSTNGLVSHAHLVTKVYFPREILPLTYVIAAVFDFLIASVVLIGLMVYYQVAVTWNVLWTVPIVLILTCLVTSMSLVFSALQVRFRDIGVALPLLLQLWMFATPVVYPLSAVPERFRWFYSLNPMVGIVESFRRTVVDGVPPDFATIGVSALIAIVLLPIAYVFFKHVEATIADVI
ncbi:MAG TPA: ABC transporter permease [Pyrinomonadaceae bacterium]|jgi:lipopolysaccharide transport system permease protein